ncbi:MAG: hypothetical protein SFZ23_15305 [Planctomycetota bacterium]|nr:hypothetical protein [Planctomycetota bacterium]
MVLEQVVVGLKALLGAVALDEFAQVAEGEFVELAELIQGEVA